MQKTVLKYILQPTTTIKMPAGAKILKIEAQDNEPCLWVLVNPEAPKVKRHFSFYGTGTPIPDIEMDYLGSFQTLQGREYQQKVWVSHVFEVFEIEETLDGKVQDIASFSSL